MSEIKTSKFLSYVLRHAPEVAGLTLDREGWASVDELIAGAERAGKPLPRDLLHRVVANNSKKRFELSSDGDRIRAVQGHSTDAVQRDYPEVEPPAELFHGTATRFLAPIRREGLRPGSRHHVHLSADTATAAEVGKRHGKVVVLTIDAAAMRAAGHVFHQAENGVWLTLAVPPVFLREETYLRSPGRLPGTPSSSCGSIVPRPTLPSSCSSTVISRPRVGVSRLL